MGLPVAGIAAISIQQQQRLDAKPIPDLKRPFRQPLFVITQGLIAIVRTTINPIKCPRIISGINPRTVWRKGNQYNIATIARSLVLEEASTMSKGSSRKSVAYTHTVKVSRFPEGHLLGQLKIIVPIHRFEALFLYKK